VLVIGKRIVELSGGRPITIEGGSAAAAVEVMTRFATHPKWLIYLPPTMSPPATTARDGLLEQPDEAFAYYRDDGVGAVVVEEKHMGSRALLVVCRDEAAARDRFGVTTGETGAIYTRTGRAFFQERTTAEAVLARIRAVMTEVGFLERHATRSSQPPVFFETLSDICCGEVWAWHVVQEVTEILIGRPAAQCSLRNDLPLSIPFRPNGVATTPTSRRDHDALASGTPPCKQDSAVQIYLSGHR